MLGKQLLKTFFILSIVLLFPGLSSASHDIHLPQVILGQVSSVSFNGSDLASIDPPDGRTQLDENEEAQTAMDNIAFPYARGHCDMQVVTSGTGDENYIHILKHLRSVGAPTWLDCRAVCQTTMLSFFLMTLDNAGDNRTATKSIVKAIAENPRVMTMVIWCFLHQSHLIVEALYKLLDGWSWSFETLLTTYYSGVKICCNTWRSYGIPRKLEKAEQDSFGNCAVKMYVPALPARPQRVRWGTGDSCERALHRGFPVLGPVFQNLFPDAKRAKRPRRELGDDLEPDYAEVVSRGADDGEEPHQQRTVSHHVGRFDHRERAINAKLDPKAVQADERFEEEVGQ